MKEKNLKKLTILHSNDMHGDFQAEQVDDKLIGGVSFLSGYIQKVREEEENVLYVVSGDMFRGSVIDSEFKGLSTIEIMNLLGPDVATLGNHEIDYGIGHLLFLEKCARFPIINANLYLTTNQIRLFKSHEMVKIGGMKILFIGILTEEVLAQARQDRLIGSFVDVREAAAEVGKICNAYQTEDVDLTVLLTHIGFEQDKQLAALLDPRWGIDLIIGGHSHTFLEQPHVETGIPIVQAVTGTDQIGRFDILVDTDKNAVDSYTWELIPIDDSHCPRDTALETLIGKYQAVTTEKYSRYITRLADTYTHPRRDRESQLGKRVADILRDSLGLDIMMLGSGSLRMPQMGPIVTLKELTQMFPFHEEIFRITLTGQQLKDMLTHVYRPEALKSDHAEYYQYSKGMKIVVSLGEERIKELFFEGAEIPDEKRFRIGIQGYHFKNMEEILGLKEEMVAKNAPCKVVATTVLDVLEEILCQMELLVCPEDERWVMMP